MNYFKGNVYYTSNSIQYINYYGGSISKSYQYLCNRNTSCFEFDFEL